MTTQRYLILIVGLVMLAVGISSAEYHDEPRSPPESAKLLTPAQLEFARECALRDTGLVPNWMEVCEHRARALYPASPSP